MINVGRLRNRINVLTWTEGENELGQDTTILKIIKTTWAEIHLLKSREYIEANMLKNKTTYKITLRWFDGLTEEMFIEYGKKLFSITSICDMEMKHKYYELICEETTKKKEKREMEESDD